MSNDATSYAIAELAIKLFIHGKDDLGRQRNEKAPRGICVGIPRMTEYWRVTGGLLESYWRVADRLLVDYW